MITNVVRKIVGSKNERELRRLWPAVHQITALEPEMQRLSDEALRAKTGELRARLGDGATLDDILPEAFAAVREASCRTTGLRHFDVQLLGGIVLHQGRIAEMKTGEGKTLVATLAIYLNALEGKGAHVVTVNDYLARRDVQWMGPIYHYLGLKVGSIVHDVSYLFDPTFIVKDYRYLNLRPVERREAYQADVTYGTNNEFGFDYLRDNMKFSLDEYVQRELHYAIVDEVDNILIDEARTPLIISGPAEESTDKYYRIDRVIPRLRRDVDYTIDEKLRNALLTEEGVAKLEQLLGVHNLYDPSQIEILHHVNQALKAHTLFKRDVDYVVKDGQVIIVDEFTGRLMPGRRWSDGLHQAVEAKERVRIERENQTLATITIQNYFRMYKKLAGMTGTADTEAVEFKKIYNLDVVVVPTNKPLVRTDYPDVVYRTEREKFEAVIEEIVECHQRGQPVLVGTTSVEKSERLSRMLKRRGVRHNVLNAVNHEAEANIIAQAGREGAVTIATNMAGRGTDILLGGNPEFLVRAEMEHEWLSRSAVLPLEAGKRYEDALRDLRERYDDAVRRATEQYEGELRVLDEERARALGELTEARRRLQKGSPFRTLREEFEEVASRMQIGGERYEPAETEQLREVRERYEAALFDAAPSGGAPDRSALESARTRFDRLLDTLEAEGIEGVEALVRRERKTYRVQEEIDPVGEIQGARARYLEALGSYELATLLGAVSNGAAPESGGGEAAAYLAAERAYAEAERRYQEKRTPYEEALAKAEREYEETRQKYVKAVAEAREQLDKAPDQLRARSEETLERYRRICAEEREKVVAAGGLHILGTERHESRRIDNQLRGRGGRQGDPGTSRFYLSLEDDLLRIFGADRIQGLMGRLGMEEGVPIEHRLITRAIENAQKKVEGHNFDIRKHLLEYDDVLNKQREVIYSRRRDVLAGENLKEDVLEMAEELVDELVDQFASEELPARQWDWKRIDEGLFKRFMMRLDIPEAERERMTPEGLEEHLLARVRSLYDEKERLFSPPVLRHLEKVIMLQTMDFLWRDHLLSMDHLKEGIGLRGYGQRNPLQEYQREGFELFEGMMRRMQEEVVEKLFSVQLARQQDAERLEQEQRELLRRQALQARLSGGGAAAAAQGSPAKVTTVRRGGEKVGRNDPCPCGSGRKFKKCCGR